MSTQKFKIKKQGNYFVAYDIEKKDVSYGKINIKTGQCIGGTLCFEALREHWESVKPKVVKTSYKLWIVIEEFKELSDGSEEFRDMKEEETRSCGAFSSLEEAYEQMNEIASQFEGDFTKD